MQIWPTWWLPLQVQPLSHAVFFGPIVTVLENMISECALRLQSGIWEFVNNIASLNFDMRTWFGRLLQNNRDIFTMLKTPMYVVRTNPFLDGSPLVCKTVRMQSCGTIVRELVKPYGVHVDVTLWKPGDAQPDRWANLDQPTYVVTVKDRSQIEGPTKTVLDSVLRTVVDLGGSLTDMFQPIIQGVPGMQGVYVAPLLGIYFTEPWAYLIAPDAGKDGSVLRCEVHSHAQQGWQHIIGGKSPKWLNDLINSTLSWILDSIMIVIGFTGVPSNVGAPRLRLGGTDIRPEHSRRIYERQFFGLPDAAALRPARRIRPVPPGHRAVHRDRLGPVQHRGTVPVHHRDLGLTRIYQRHSNIPQRRGLHPWPGCVPGNAHVCVLHEPNQGVDRLHREHQLDLLANQA